MRSGKPEKTISAILNGDSRITPSMAVLFENVLKIPLHFWLNRQRDYDEFKVREERKALLRQSVHWARQFPIIDMVKKGWIVAQPTAEEKTSELLKVVSA